MARILIIDDDRSLAELLAMHLEDLGHETEAVGRLRDADARLGEFAPDAVLLDYQLPDGTGLQMLERLLAWDPVLPVVMMTGVGDTGLAIEAIKQGAYDFIRKPMDQAELDATLANALTARGLAGKVEAVVSADDYQVSVGSIVGHSRAIIDVCKTVGRVAPTGTTVLITGESGTGKEVVARAIHHHSGRTGLFLAVNCAALVESLLESELFGHEKGAFTGAVSRKPGKFELADDGTLFLDEIGELSPALQAKLLRIVQERSYERVGGTQTLRTGARVIAATHRDLRAMVADRSFREDLYYRLNVVALHLPPLRERPDDLTLLVEHLLRRINRQLHKAVTGIAPLAWQRLRAYDWPGNVRELENVLTRAVVLAHGEVLTPELIALGEPGESGAVGPQGRWETLDEVEERHVRAVLAHTQGHKGRACEILAISRPALDRKIQRYGIEVVRGESGD